MKTVHFSPGTHPAKAPCLLSCGAISRARRVAGCRAGLGGEVRRFVAVARLQSRYGNGQYSVLTSPTLPYPHMFPLITSACSAPLPAMKSHNQCLIIELLKML